MRGEREILRRATTLALLIALEHGAELAEFVRGLAEPGRLPARKYLESAPDPAPAAR